MALRVAFEWLNACSGCEMSLLDLGMELLELVRGEVDIVHAPLLMDHKYQGPAGDGQEISLPRADLGFVSGGVATEEHAEVLAEMRRQCDFLVAIGTCATHGGIPALMNGQDRQRSWADIFAAAQPGAAVPAQGLPAPLPRVFACDEKITVDLLLPGCPPPAELLGEVLRARLEGRPAVLPKRSVCDTCPTRREGKGEVGSARRLLENAACPEDGNIAAMRCLLEQGLLCMGPVTLAGCAGDGAPRCLAARVPCRGCFGPLRHDGNPLLDMMNAMASNRIDRSTIVDRRSLLRFAGAHGRLRPLKKRE